MPVAGIDIGAGTAKIAVLDGGKLIFHHVVPVRASIIEATQILTNEMEKATGLTVKSLNHVVSTGYGRDAIPFADKTISEIIAHARGVHFLLPQGHTIIDIGAQDSKVMKLNSTGSVGDFVMNDKCAAGCGRFLEVMSHALGVRLEEMGPLSLAAKSVCKISSTCTVFAESEVVSQRANGCAIESLIAGIHQAIARRVAVMSMGMELEGEMVFTGGVAKNSGVKRALEEVMGTKLLIPEEPQITGALGAALYAAEIC